MTCLPGMDENRSREMEMILLGFVWKSREEFPDGNQSTVTRRGAWKFPVHMVWRLRVNKLSRNSHSVSETLTALAGASLLTRVDFFTQRLPWRMTSHHEDSRLPEKNQRPYQVGINSPQTERYKLIKMTLYIQYVNWLDIKEGIEITKKH